MDNISENNRGIKQFSLKKAERLCSKRIIDKLFAEGDSVLQYPLKMVFLKTKLPYNCPAQSAFTVSKKVFKRAVKRNRVKRLLREAYRINKHLIYEALNDDQLAVFIIFIGKNLPEFGAIEIATQKGLKKIVMKLSEQNSANNEE